ncbi:DUF1697 domain-containing protein [Actinophytocola xanthii]|uniref:DUF1697 domain-containing protein n=1 Tax=Actinophytocola xanthii TaxID=1912961 RepID=A0A1Q8CGC0_9PSEU|nr:DUF1697 domain-containing protein [Actinophytocola xanthii]OLF13408.1 hypothetical protein BU204_27450 [Actinophytocola xanthii]
MTSCAALLRGINLGSRRRVAMADLRTWLAELGHAEVRTLLQSGNAVFRTERELDEVRAELSAHLTERAGFPVACVLRTAAELAEVVAADPLGAVATNPSRYFVVFLDRPVTSPDLEPDAFAPELFHLGEREVYFWVPEGVRDSKVLAAFPARADEVATMRNWNTVTKLLAMAQAVPDLRTR